MLCPSFRLEISTKERFREKSNQKYNLTKIIENCDDSWRGGGLGALGAVGRELGGSEVRRGAGWVFAWGGAVGAAGCVGDLRVCAGRRRWLYLGVCAG